VLLLHIVKVLIIKFESDFISTTLEAQPKWDWKVPISITQKEGLDIYCALSGISLERVGQLTKTQRKNCR